MRTSRRQTVPEDMADEIASAYGCDHLHAEKLVTFALTTAVYPSTAGGSEFTRAEIYDDDGGLTEEAIEAIRLSADRGLSVIGLSRTSTAAECSTTVSADPQRPAWAITLRNADGRVITKERANNYETAELAATIMRSSLETSPLGPAVTEQYLAYYLPTGLRERLDTECHRLGLNIEATLEDAVRRHVEKLVGCDSVEPEPLHRIAAEIARRLGDLGAIALTEIIDAGLSTIAGERNVPLDRLFVAETRLTPSAASDLLHWVALAHPGAWDTAQAGTPARARITALEGAQRWWQVEVIDPQPGSPFAGDGRTRTRTARNIRAAYRLALQMLGADEPAGAAAG